MIRKAALRIGAPALLVLMAWNAYLAVNHLRQIDRMASLALECTRIQSGISSVLRDLTDMETGERGYLLTENDAYLQPYTDAKGRIAADFASLRRDLANPGQGGRSPDPDLESVAQSMQDGMEHAISLRQQGYRHRAFKLVDSNEGMEDMDKARTLLSSLSAAENSNFARFDRERNASLSKSLRETIIANSCLLVLTGCLFALGRYHGKVLEHQAAQSREELAVRDLQLEKLTSALSNQARSNTSVIEANARLLLQNYGGFLPRQGHEYAEQIKEASARMERLRQDLVGGPGSVIDDKRTFDA